jgi:hypothetical protein
MTELIAASRFIVSLALVLGFCTQAAIAETGEARLTVDYRANLLRVYVDRVPVREVAKAIADETGATVSLVGSDALADQRISARVKDEPLEKAVAEIFRGFSTAVYPVAGSSMPKVSVFLTVLDNSASELDEETSEPPQTQTAIPPSYAVPRDLDDFMPVPEPEPTFEPHSSVTSEGAIDPEAQAEIEAAQSVYREQRVKRAISAAGSSHSHIRRMAVNELAGSRDRRATAVLADIAISKDIAAEERANAAEALWRHAGDSEFQDTEANDVLRFLAQDEDPSVSTIAQDALRDMERYRQRYR